MMGTDYSFPNFRILGMSSLSPNLSPNPLSPNSQSIIRMAAATTVVHNPFFFPIAD